MNRDLLEILAVSVVFGVIFGPLIARSSSRREKVYGGTLAQVFHMIGAGAMAGLLPGIFTSLIVGGGFREAFPVALGLLATSLFRCCCLRLWKDPPAMPSSPSKIAAGRRKMRGNRGYNNSIQIKRLL